MENISSEDCDQKNSDVYDIFGNDTDEDPNYEPSIENEDSSDDDNPQPSTSTAEPLNTRSRGKPKGQCRLTITNLPPTSSQNQYNSI